MKKNKIYYLNQINAPEGTFRKRMTAGEMSLKAAADNTKYDSLEVGYNLTNDIAKELAICAERHDPIFNEEKYCIGYVLAGDPLIKNVMRRKFFAMLYLPSPRPNQTIFLYNKTFQRFEKRLWVLPNAMTMAELSEMSTVHKSWQSMKNWSDSFFRGTFWEDIRKEHNIDMLSEIEYLNAHREELIKAGCKEVDPILTQPFDFSKIAINKIIDPLAAISS
jgi:hypothetical protein